MLTTVIAAISVDQILLVKSLICFSSFGFESVLLKRQVGGLLKVGSIAARIRPHSDADERQKTDHGGYGAKGVDIEIHVIAPVYLT